MHPAGPFPAALHHKAVQPLRRQVPAQRHHRLLHGAVRQISPPVKRVRDHQLRRGKLQSAHDPAVRQRVARENIHVYALMHQLILRAEFLHAGRAVFPQLGENMGQWSENSFCR